MHEGIACDLLIVGSMLYFFNLLNNFLLVPMAYLPQKNAIKSCLNKNHIKYGETCWRFYEGSHLRHEHLR